MQFKFLYLHDKNFVASNTEKIQTKKSACKKQIWMQAVIELETLWLLICYLYHLTNNVRYYNLCSYLPLKFLNETLYNRVISDFIYQIANLVSYKFGSFKKLYRNTLFLQILAILVVEIDTKLLKEPD